MRDYSFGDFLRKLRKRHRLSQYQLGRLVGVSDKAVSKWENGLGKPRSHILFRLSDVLEITVDELLSCRSIPNENQMRKEYDSMQNELWKKAEGLLREHYGERLPVEVWNRYLGWRESKPVMPLKAKFPPAIASSFEIR